MDPQQLSHHKAQYLDKQTLLNKNQLDLCSAKDLLISHRTQDLGKWLKSLPAEMGYSGINQANKLQHKEQACSEEALQLPILCLEVEIIRIKLNN